jgi:hypothetical protein
MPHEQAAWNWLQEQLTPEEIDTFASIFGGGQLSNWRPPVNGILLKVPYERKDNEVSGHGWRECMSSSCAMIARYYDKVCSADEYESVRRRYWNSTILGSNVSALRAFGLSAYFTPSATVSLLESELLARRPLATGWLHKGTDLYPQGGGHWSVVIGFDSKVITHNDPNGEADMVGGGYVNHSNGKGIRYNRKHWLKRWLPEGPKSGWAIAVEKP